MSVQAEVKYKCVFTYSKRGIDTLCICITSCGDYYIIISNWGYKSIVHTRSTKLKISRIILLKKYINVDDSNILTLYSFSKTITWLLLARFKLKTVRNDENIPLHDLPKLLRSFLKWFLAVRRGLEEWLTVQYNFLCCTSTSCDEKRELQCSHVYIWPAHSDVTVVHCLPLPANVCTLLPFTAAVVAGVMNLSRSATAPSVLSSLNYNALKIAEREK